MFNFNYWKYIIFIFPLLILVGCSTTKPRYYTTYVERRAVHPNSVLLQTKHSYYHISNSKSEKGQPYKQFQTDYAPYISREFWTLYDRGESHGELQYRAEIEPKNLNTEQEKILQQQYAAKMENQMWTVNFVWKDWLDETSVRVNKVDKKYTLEIPQRLTIVETYKILTPFGELLFIPFMPIYMMVGCAFAEASCI